MKKIVKLFLSVLMIFSTITFVQANEENNIGTTYYVSSKNGSDQNDGTSEDQAFQSLNKINELTLQPGDEVLLECGSIFNDQYLHIQGSGSEEASIIISSYGEGAMPIINTNAKGIWYQDYGITLDDPNHRNRGNVSSSILLYDVEYIEISNLEITNSGADPNGLVYNHVNYMNRTGIAAVAQNIGTVDHIVIENCNIHDVYGNVYDKHMNNGGIYFTCFLPNNEQATGISRYNDVLIQNNVLDTVNRWGIAVGYTAYHGQFTTAELADETVIKYGSTNVVVRNNYLNEVGGDAITMMYCFRPLVESNVAEGTARHINDTDYANSWRGQVAASIWAWKCKDCILQYNEVYDTYLNPDGQAWDADWGDGTLYQYNYSHNNLGGCYMICGVQAINSIFRYNISYLDKQDVLDLQNNPNGEIYNNTFIMDPNAKIVGMSGGTNTTVYNNIFYHTGVNAKSENYFPDSTSVDYESNLYYNYTSVPNNDSSAVTKDPKFVNLASAPTAYSQKNAYEDQVAYGHEEDGVFAGFKLASDSPAINAGTYIASNGGYDFFGNPLDTKADIGAYDSQSVDFSIHSEYFDINDNKITNVVKGMSVASFKEKIIYDEAIHVIVKKDVELNDDALLSEAQYELILEYEGNQVTYIIETSEVDKTSLQALVDEVKNLKAKDYTKESFADFKVALDEAKAILNNQVSTQKEVNDAKTKLQQTFNQLVVYIDEGDLINTEANKNRVSVLDFSTQCSSSMEGVGIGSAASSLDYNTTTYWHSDWNEESNKKMPQFVSYDLGQNYYVSMIKFLPRQTGQYINGDIFGLNIYVSEDANFAANELVGSFTYDQHDGINLTSRDYHYAALAQPTYGRYVKFEVSASGSHEGADLYASMAEIRFYGSEELEIIVDKEGLVEAIETAQAINANEYSEDSYAVLAQAIELAIAINEDENATQAEVDEAVAAINTAIDGLALKPVAPTVNKEALVAAISDAKAIDASKYTAESVAVLASAISAAEAVNAKADATQAEVDAAIKAIEDAQAALKAKEEPTPEVKPVMDFYDVQDKSAWFYGSVEKAFQKGLMQATGKAPVNGKAFFEPDANITRGMVATVLYRMAGMPKVTYSGKFPDVKNNLWYTNAIEWAATNGVVSGYKDGTFGPDANITRQDLAIMLRNYANKAGLATNATVNFDAFKDGKTVDSYAKSAVAWCVDAKLMSGANKADGKYLNPKANATRAECAKMFALLDDAIIANNK